MSRVDAMATSTAVESVGIETYAELVEAPLIDPSRVTTANTLRDNVPLHSLGVVRGVTVRSRNVFADIGAGFKSLAGGEVKTWTTLCERARQDAVERMFEDAANRDANAIVAVRYNTTSIAPGITEVVAYGMAVTNRQTTHSRGLDLDQSIPRNLVCTSNELPGYSLQHSLGVVQGLTVRSRNAFASIGAGLKSIAGGEIKIYTKMCEDARQEAYTRMLAEASERGADAVLAVRYETSELVPGVTEVLAFGTAVSSVAAYAENTEIMNAGLAMNMVTTSNVLPNLNIQHSLGVVQGITVRSSNVVAQIGAGFKTLVGGEVQTWSTLCRRAREEAFRRLMENASSLGAKGIVAMRYDTNQLTESGIVEITAYGTAVSDEPLTHVDRTFEGIPPHLVSSDTHIPNFNARRSLGVARGVSVRSVHLIRSIGAGLKSIVGGEIRNFTKMCKAARLEAYERMLANAFEMGATAIVGVRYESNDLQQGVVEVIAYGTAISDAIGVSNPSDTIEGDDFHGVRVSTTNEISDSPMPQELGVVRGITVRSRNVVANIGASLKAGFVGGEVTTWTNLCEHARKDAFERMLQEAKNRGATGIVGFRFETNEIIGGVTEVLAYGTAVA